MDLRHCPAHTCIVFNAVNENMQRQDMYQWLLSTTLSRLIATKQTSLEMDGFNAKITRICPIAPTHHLQGPCKLSAKKYIRPKNISALVTLVPQVEASELTSDHIWMYPHDDTDDTVAYRRPHWCHWEPYVLEMGLCMEKSRFVLHHVLSRQRTKKEPKSL